MFVEIYKQYLFKSMYLQRHIENMVKAGYINGVEDGFVLDADDNDNLLITVTSDGIDNSRMFVVITRHSDNESILGYHDKGETIRYLKGLGRLNTAAYIASCLKNGQEFLIMDKEQKPYGIKRIDIMGNKYIVTGGYANPTGFFNINGLHVKEVTDLVMRKLICDDQDFCMFDPKSLFIKICEGVASRLSASIFSKPYIDCDFIY